MSNIPKSIFSTKDISFSKRYEAFKESMGVVFDVSHPQQTGPGFFGDIQSHLLGEILFVNCAATGQRFRRTPEMIAKDGVDHYIVQVFLRGKTQRQKGHAESFGRPDNVLIIDASQPWEAVNSDFNNLSLVIPRRLLAGSLIHENDHHGRMIGSENPFGGLLLNFIRTLSCSIENMSFADIDDVSQVSMSLLSSALNRATHRSSHGLREKTFDLLLLKKDIKRFLENNLHNPELDMDSLAKEFGVSRSHLYRIFDAEGGIADYLRNRRLELAYRRLLSSKYHKDFTAKVASSVGYKSTSAFIRAFKRKFNLTPSEVIVGVTPTFEVASEHEKQRLWEKWFLSL